MSIAAHCTCDRAGSGFGEDGGYCPRHSPRRPLLTREAPQNARHPNCIYPLCGCTPSACNSDPATEIRRRIRAIAPMCKCGQPWVLNTVHRENTPCYRAADPADAGCKTNAENVAEEATESVAPKP